MKLSEYLDRIDKLADKYEDNNILRNLGWLDFSVRMFSEGVKRRDYGHAFIYADDIGRNCSALRLEKPGLSREDWAKICGEDLIKFLLDAGKSY